jgi:uncharacterized membrane protein YeaQ/YmgE (transglycosylase-associated protein family)
MAVVDPGWQVVIERSLNEFLVWVGFGTIVGLTAKAIMPGKDPGGAVATLMMGIVGTVIGCGTLAFFLPSAKITPISPLGICRSHQRIVSPAGVLSHPQPGESPEGRCGDRKRRSRPPARPSLSASAACP